MLSMLMGSTYGLFGTIVGSTVGLGGGVWGTYLGIKNTRGRRQRRFAVKAAIITWCSLAVFLGLLIGLPFPYGFIMWVPYGIFLPLGINYMNKRLHQLNVEASLHE